MTRSLRVGLVDPDTSHADAFVPVLRTLGHRVTGVLDRSLLWGPDHPRAFAARHGIEVVARDEEDLASHCDVAVLLSCDWDSHAASVGRLRAAGLPVCVDKPLAGRAGELRALATLAGTPPLAGGSSLRFAPEVTAWRARGRRADAVRVSCTGPALYYGIHAVSMAAGLLGPGFVAARGRSVEGVLAGDLRHRSGVVVSVEVPGHAPGTDFRAEITTDAGTEVVEPDFERLYPSYLEASLRDLVGDRPAALPPAALVEPELALLALAYSCDAPAGAGGRWVGLDETPDEWHPWDGAAFARSYRDAAAGRG